MQFLPTTIIYSSSSYKEEEWRSEGVKDEYIYIYIYIYRMQQQQLKKLHGYEDIIYTYLVLEYVSAQMDDKYSIVQ
jgi:hypothetical protein